MPKITIELDDGTRSTYIGDINLYNITADMMDMPTNKKKWYSKLALQSGSLQVTMKYEAKEHSDGRTINSKDADARMSGTSVYSYKPGERILCQHCFKGMEIEDRYPTHIEGKIVCDECARKWILKAGQHTPLVRPVP